MEKVITDYLFEKIKSDFKSNNVLSDELCKTIDKYPIIDYLRERVIKEDVSWLMEVAKNNMGKKGDVAISLLKKHINEPLVKDFLYKEWEMTEVFDRKYSIMWRILDFEDLELNMHEKIYEYLKNNKEVFITEKAEWFGGYDNVLNVCQKRLSDKKFPKTKNWVYLFSLIASPDKEGVKKIIKKYSDSKDEFTSKVASELLAYIEE